MAISDRFNTIIGEVAEVTVDSRGAIQVDRVVAVVDPGHIIHPNAAEGQIEGGIIFGLSAALFSEITIKDGRVKQGNFDDYAVARLSDTPKIEVHLMSSGGARRGGIGEAGTAPIAAAIGNAIFSATGKRLRQLPLKLT
jgi:isoquinoline 1-oxidoreductase beta subunit